MANRRDSSDNAPVIVGVGQRTWREVDTSRTPVDALHEVAKLANADAHSQHLLGTIDALGMVRFIADAIPGIPNILPGNPGQLLAQRLGINGAHISQGTIGGNTPQHLINHFAKELAAGRHQAVLITGVELLATLAAALRHGDDISHWSDPKMEAPHTIGKEKEGLNTLEKLHGLYEPINTYPLFENSLRHQLGLSTAEHSWRIATLCSNMSAVAANNVHAWSQQALSAEDISTVTERNRYIGYPYTKTMNARLNVDMGAAVIMTTVGKARALGVDDSQLIYLRGGADVNDIWHPSERPALHESPAIRLAASSLLRQADVSIEVIDHFDIYSCFPSAVQIACHAIGISPFDPRGVTVTGGMPYFGGPGNNYSLHAVAKMVTTLRGKAKRHGLVTANGYYLTKHSLGLYASEPDSNSWQAVDSNTLQRQVDAGPRRHLANNPTGPASIDSFTVAFDRNGPSRGIIIASNAKGERILANTLAEESVFKQLLTGDPIGRGGKVRRAGEINIFEF